MVVTVRASVVDSTSRLAVAERVGHATERERKVPTALEASILTNARARRGIAGRCFRISCPVYLLDPDLFPLVDIAQGQVLHYYTPPSQCQLHHKLVPSAQRKVVLVDSSIRIRRDIYQMVLLPTYLPRFLRSS